jgi:hypothetical protein
MKTTKLTHDNLKRLEGNRILKELDKLIEEMKELEKETKEYG